MTRKDVIEEESTQGRKLGVQIPVTYFNHN